MSPLSILCVEITQNYFIWRKKKKQFCHVSRPGAQPRGDTAGAGCRGLSGQPHSTCTLGSSRVTHSFTYLHMHEFIYLIIDYLGFTMLSAKSDWLTYPQFLNNSFLQWLTMPTIMMAWRDYQGPGWRKARGWESGKVLWGAGRGHAARAQEDARLHTQEASWKQEITGTLERQVTAEIKATR